MASSGIIPILPPGFVSIYGGASIYGFGGVSSGITFGRIYKMASSNSGNYTVGQNVLFPYVGEHSVTYAGTQYFLIDETKIILLEQESAPPDEDIS